MVNDPGFKYSDDYRRLYSKWKLMQRKGICEEWKNRYAFFGWAMDNGYSTFGCTIKRIDNSKVYSPDNCYFIAEIEKPVVQEFVNRWNTAVNRIRQHYGMEPFELWGDGDD